MSAVKDDKKDRDPSEVGDSRTLSAPPTACPAAYKATVELLDEDLQKTFVHYRVHWFFQMHVAKMGYTASRDVAMRWDKDTDHVSMSRTLGVFDGQNGFDEESSRLAVIKFCNAVEQCVTDKKRKHSELPPRPLQISRPC